MVEIKCGKRVSSIIMMTSKLHSWRFGLKIRSSVSSVENKLSSPIVKDITHGELHASGYTNREYFQWILEVFENPSKCLGLEFMSWTV